MDRKLIKVATELSVGSSTIVEHLSKKGFSIEDKPTAKVSDDMYNVLCRDFQEAIATKKKADELLIGTRPIVKKDAPAPVTNTPPQPVIKREPISILRKETVVESIKTPSAVPAPKVDAETKSTPTSVPDAPVPSANVAEKVEKPTPTPPAGAEPSRVPGLKVLGHIDLDANKPAPKPKQDAPRDRPNNRDRDRDRNRQGNNNRPADNNNRSNDNRSNNNNNNNNQGNRRSELPNPPAPKPVVAPTPPPAPVSDAPAQLTNVQPEMVRAETPQLKGLKILGKIDTDQFERKPKKKVKKEVGRGGTNTGNPNNRPAGDRKPATPGAPGSNPSGASGENAEKRRKRKRKKVTSSDSPNTGAATGGNNTGQGNNQGGGQGQGQGGGNRNNQGGGQGQGGGNRNNQGGGQGQGGGNRGGQGQGQGGGGNRGPRTNNNDQPREISQKTIDDKIRATMALLGGGNKNKRQKVRRDKREVMREKNEARELEENNGKLQVTEFISVSELASLMDVPVTKVIMTCMSLGVMVSINQRLDAEIIELVAEEFGHDVDFISAEDQTQTDEVEVEDDPADMLPRAPIVTVMGHVDHGKTSLLDFIRKANVVSGEAGGITQHIGAYEVVTTEGKKVTFLDTPGHEAFTAMRARGAKVTDVAVIIIAADDNIMPQTKEAIAHAQAASVPMVFAINKIDKAGADPERIKSELAQMNLLVEDWGGKYQSQDISAKGGQNIDLLLEKILFEAEILDLKANPNKMATGTVIEASLDKGRGYVTKILIQAGTLSVGDPIVAGDFSGKVKAMFNERGKKVTAAGPATPVLVLGLAGAPQAGEKFKVMESETEARQIASKRAQIHREQANRASKRISLDEIGRRLALGTFKELNLIVKGDVDGSVEALSDSLLKLSIDTIQVNVIHKAVGQIIESDVLLASASDAIIIGFQVRPSPSARKLAEREGVQIKGYSIIYEAIEEIKMAIEGMLEPTKEESIVGQIEIREVYKISKVGTVAGCYVTEGKFVKATHIRVIRDGIVIFPTREGAHGKLGSLKRMKDDVKEVKAGFECGLTIDGFNDIKEGDTVEGYEIIEVKRKLDK